MHPCGGTTFNREWMNFSLAVSLWSWDFHKQIHAFWSGLSEAAPHTDVSELQGISSSSTKWKAEHQCRTKEESKRKQQTMFNCCWSWRSLDCSSHLLLHQSSLVGKKGAFIPQATAVSCYQAVYLYWSSGNEIHFLRLWVWILPHLQISVLFFAKQTKT